MRTGIRWGRVAEAALLCVASSVSLGLSPSYRTVVAVSCELRTRLRGLDSSNARRAVNRLRRAGYLSSRGGALDLTRLGKQTLLRRCIGVDTLPVPRNWDGRWRAVVFDVPDYRGLERKLLRKLLKSIGFVLFQKSVWLHPAPCGDAVRNAVSALGLDRHVALATIERLDGDEPVRKKFRL